MTEPAFPTASLLAPPPPRAGQQRAYWRRPHGSGLALAVASLARGFDGMLVTVTRDTHAAHTLEAELRAFSTGETPILHFPDWETLPYDAFSPHAEIVSQRVSTLYRLPGLSRGLLVVPIATLMQRLAPREFMLGSNLALKRGQRFDLMEERRRLDSAGYRHVPQVLEPGDYATRGSLVDLFPMGSGEPYRIELFDEVVDTIRTFDPETQRSLAQVDAVELLAAREFPLTEAATKSVRNILRERFPIDPRKCAVYQDLREGGSPAGIEYYLPLFFERTDTLFDYLRSEALFGLDVGALASADAFWLTTNDRYEQRRHDIERPVLAPGELY
ncbi:MAG TPA: transcription-repair coupling factor, partial [Xanthomonadales bacterium]|nr:transcription-repair coupling factor [Xanthomonadales bacterium]